MREQRKGTATQCGHDAPIIPARVRVVCRNTQIGVIRKLRNCPVPRVCYDVAENGIEVGLARSCGIDERGPCIPFNTSFSVSGVAKQLPNCPPHLQAVYLRKR